MKTSPFWRGLALLLVVGLVLPAFLAGDAQADRRSGLMGNHFIKDADDAKALPQDAVLYTGRFAIDFLNSSAAGNGEAAVIVGEGMTWQWRASNDNAFAPLANFAMGGTIYSPANPLSGLDLNGNTDRNPANMQFITFGVASGDNVSRWGVNLNVGLDKSETINPDPAVGETTNSAGLYNLIFGYSMENMDLAGEFVIGKNNYKRAIPNNTAAARDLDGSVTGITLYGRGDLAGAFMGEDLYWAGAFGYAKSTSDHYYTATDVGEDSYSKVALMVEGGRVYQVNDLTAAVSVVFDYGKVSDDPGEPTTDPVTPDSVDDDTDILLPGFNFAAEYAVTDHLTIRGAAKTRYTWSKAEETVGPQTLETKTRGYVFDWVLGMGYTRGMAEFQVVINPSWIETGSLLGSQDEDMFGAAEFTWNWGTK